MYNQMRRRPAWATLSLGGLTRGRLIIRMRDREVTLGPGELFVVPRGVEHQPFAEEETEALLIELAGTPNTGDVATAAPHQAI